MNVLCIIRARVWEKRWLGLSRNKVAVCIIRARVWEKRRRKFLYGKLPVCIIRARVWEKRLNSFHHNEPRNVLYAHVCEKKAPVTSPIPNTSSSVLYAHVCEKKGRGVRSLLLIHAVLYAHVCEKKVSHFHPSYAFETRIIRARVWEKSPSASTGTPPTGCIIRARVWEKRRSMMWRA